MLLGGLGGSVGCRGRGAVVVVSWVLWAAVNVELSWRGVRGKAGWQECQWVGAGMYSKLEAPAAAEL